MCGRYADPTAKAFERYEVKFKQAYYQSFNVLPGSMQPILIKNSPLRVELAKWGLVPAWSKEFKASYTTFNARKEGLLESRIYKLPFLTQRCLVLASAFYEWHTLSDGEKIRYVVRPKNREDFSFAGFYEIWKDAEEKEFYSYTIATDEPTPRFKEVHSREACILDAGDEEKWLNKETTQDELMKILHPCPDREIEFFPARVNSIKRDMDGPKLVEAA